MNNETTSQICKALGDSNRLQIIESLTTGEKCACKLLEKFNITQPTLSHHMKILCDCNLVTSRKEGKWIYYTLNCNTFSDFKNFISSITCIQNKATIKYSETTDMQGGISDSQNAISSSQPESSLRQNKNSTCDCSKSGNKK